MSARDPSLTLADAADAVAVIGLAGRFPSAPSAQALWENVKRGVDAISRLTVEDLEGAGVPAWLASDPSYVPAAGVLDGVDLFDASFFGLSPREAALMDPQQRLFLECAWESLEDAGYDARTYPGPIGVFGGTSVNNYWLFNVVPSLGIPTLQAQLANEKDYLATRVAYKLDLKGPAVSVQTACSTSLVAVHFACQSLINAECDMALAGGVSVRVPQRAGYLALEGALSPSGRCRAFDAKADGTVFGSGV